jgi:glutamate-1-semialdehyde 2,1-aminomutase/spore coat polysaccharide biosynthesis protein SpsF
MTKKMGLKNGIKKSNELYERAKKVIASGTNTFSRAPGVFPDGVAPKFLVRQYGSHVWDVDDNEYIDMVMGCGPVTIGHNHPAINDAIKKQMENGILFSMLNPLEVEVAEKLVDCIPCAEMVKFSKNGSDVCSASIKLARHVTQKDMIFCWGYHGFADWYISTTDRNAGIPQAVKDLTKLFEYNDLDGLKEMFRTYKGNVAAVIMEPIIAEKPKDDFLNEVKKLAHENGTLLIFDEMISGFRFAMGGIQEYLNVVPDLATFGKGITNGMPLGVLAGKEKYMKEFDKVFLSSTYAPEALTLAAASANIDFYKEHNVIEKLWEKGEYIEDQFGAIIKKHSVQKNVSLAGYPVRLMVNTHGDDGIQDPKIATLYQQEMFRNGILCFSGVLMLSYSHSQEDLDILVQAFDETCKVMNRAMNGDVPIDDFIEGVMGEPVFKGLRERNAVSN